MRKGNWEATSNVNLTVYAVIEEKGGGEKDRQLQSEARLLGTLIPKPFLPI